MNSEIYWLADDSFGFKGKKPAIPIINNGNKGKENSGLTHREINHLLQQQQKGKEQQTQVREGYVLGI